MIVIGICGFIGSGKDTLADYLVKEYDFLKISFGSTVKDVISSIFGWRRDLLEGDTEESRNFRNTVDEFWSKELNIPNFTPRMAMQKIATDLFREHFDDGIWVKIVKRKIMDNKHRNIVIPDCRFQNESKLITDCDGIIINVNRELPEWFFKYRYGKTPIEELTNLHQSETSWIKWNFNYVLDNYGTLDEYYTNIKNLVEEIRTSGLNDPFTTNFNHNF